MVLTGKRGGGLAVLMVLATFSASAATPLEFEGADSGRIEHTIAAALKDGSRFVMIPAKSNGEQWFVTRAITQPSDFILEVDDCVVQLSPGTKDNIIRNAGAVEGRITTNRNITVRGNLIRGNVFRDYKRDKNEERDKNEG